MMACGSKVRGAAYCFELLSDICLGRGRMKYVDPELRGHRDF